MIGKSSFRIGGHFEVACYDENGNLKWRENVHNFVTDEGINHLLDTQFHGTTQVDPWYVLLAGTGTKAVGDTLASHAAWSEVTDYAGDRKEFVEGAAAAKSISNTGNVASFTINAAVTIAGAGVASVASTVSGTLFCVSDFANPRQADSPDTITVEYTLTGSDV